MTQAVSANHDGAAVQKIPVWQLVFFTIVTGGIYMPSWFIARRREINRLQSKRKMGIAIFVFVVVCASAALVVWLLSFIVGEFAVFVSQTFPTADASAFYLSAGKLRGLVNAIRWIALIIIIVQSFKLRRILDDHFNAHLKRDIRFSAPLTVLFNLFYLQHKLNRA